MRDAPDARPGVLSETVISIALTMRAEAERFDYCR